MLTYNKNNVRGITTMATLIDPFQRKIEYLRVSVTDKCNYRCSYCMPEQGVHPEGNHTEYLNYDEITRIVKAFSELGVWKIRLTGGEPLVRKNLPDLVAKINALPDVRDIALSTNAEKLAEHAQALKDAGVTRTNVSLDSLDPVKFNRITRGGDLKKVLAGLDAAFAVGMTPVKVNMVVMKQTNFDEIPAMLDYAIAKGINLRFIETMPIGSAGISVMDEYVSADQILAKLKEHVGADLLPMLDKQEAGPARVYRIAGSKAKIGVISAVSQHFCETCNRVRLTARGELALCLGQEDMVDLRTPLRAGVSDDELKTIIVAAIARKPERHHFNENRHNIQFRQMVSLGG
jgi:cyclic pyranopterin phosphate synthase